MSEMTKRLIHQLFVLSLICVVGALCLPRIHGQTNAPQDAKNYEFIGGQWFDGRRFRRQTFYSVNGTLTRRRPPHALETVNLENRFVVPPFADAHCHHFDSPYNVAQQIQMYLRDGVFYVKVQTNGRVGAIEVAGRVNTPASVDVSYAHGALTSSFGHGVEVYEGLALFRRTYPTNAEEVRRIRESRLQANNAYYIVDTADDLTRRWPQILAGRPDFIKIYLLTSEEYETRRSRSDTVGDRGLDPRLVPSIVERAHQAGLRVSAHVDTVTDYRIALSAGVDEMAHLPGYLINADDDPRKYELTEADARATARRGVWVVPAPVFYDTFNPQSSSYDAQTTARTDRVRIHNLRLLRRHRVNLAFGSDRYGRTPVDDVSYLQRLGVFSNLEMLKTWCEVTPQTIFPRRRIGRLQEGYEASFLVLDGNPIENFEHVRRIRLRFKQGSFINVQESTNND